MTVHQIKEPDTAPVMITTANGAQMEVFGKAGEILAKIAEHPPERIDELGLVIDHEPFFILRAQDIFSVMGVGSYLEMVRKWGPADPDQEESGVETMSTMKRWQRRHPSRVKYPD